MNLLLNSPRILSKASTGILVSAGAISVLDSQLVAATNMDTLAPKREREKSMITISELLEHRGLDSSKNIKLVRHKDQRYDVAELIKKGQLDTYQRYQSEHVFDCDYIISFIGLPGTKASFYGVYEVTSCSDTPSIYSEEDFLYPEMLTKEHYKYDLTRLSGFEDLESRVIIEWGLGTIKWFQKYTNKKEVIEILPDGYVREFPGYLDFVLDFEELCRIIQNPESNREWHRMLSAVAGVYLIVDGVTGKQYVGSAYGKAGILGRWQSYAKSAHGDNLQLRELVEQGPSYAANFRFTILRTLPKTLTKNEVIGLENLYKTKLGSRSFGLNSN